MRFRVGDRVRKKHLVGDRSKCCEPTGTVIEINGRWINVQHDAKPRNLAGNRFDYLEEDLEFENLLYRLADEV